jgi:hypothetical protein
MKEQRLLKQVRTIIVFFMIMMLLSGITAFPVESGLRCLMGYKNYFPGNLPGFLEGVYQAVKETNDRYPFLFYGYDWLAFAHIVIAMAFIGPLKDPVKNIWVIEWGMLSCIAVFFLAFIAGPVRHIPVYWQLIDCSFGVIGFIPLMICRKKIRQLAVIKSN